MNRKQVLTLTILFFGIYLLAQLFSLYDKQWDLTNDQRFTLSQSTYTTLNDIDQPLTVDVLLAGELPANYQRLRAELSIVLKQMRQANSFIQFNFVNPFDESSNREELLKELYAFGLTPEIDVDQASQSTEQTIVVPWIILNAKEKSVRVSLLEKNLGDSPEQRIEQSIQQLEYHIMDGIHQLLLKEKKRIAVIKSHGTSTDVKLVSFLQSLLPYYNLAPFDLKAFPENPVRTLNNLLRFDLLIISNPKAKFTVPEKFMLDQFTQKGGSSLFLIDPVTVAQDSLFSMQGTAVAYPTTVELDELFFAYGARLNKDVITDLYSAPIVLAQGENSNTEYKPYPWVFHPLAETKSNHPIGTAIGNVQQRFVSSIDTLKSPLSKTVLLASSNRSKRLTPPLLIELKSATDPIKPSNYNEQNYATTVLLEGVFPSLFSNRISPFDWEKTDSPKPAKMVLISDGNMAENQTDKGEPLELGYDKWTNNLYANKRFLQNTVHYLMGEDQRLMLRSKNVQLAFVDTVVVAQKRNTLQQWAFGLPLVILALLGGILFQWRKRKYGQ